MVWNDEFDGTSYDKSKWQAETGFLSNENDINTAGWGNYEKQYYTDSGNNISQDDGKLNITLKREEKLFFDTNGYGATANYSSGKLVSKDLFSVKYGRVDIRAKMPTGTGLWSALSMLPNDEIYGSWASSGEIDIFGGCGRTPEMVKGTLHYGSKWPDNKNASNSLNIVENGKKGTNISDWHVYSMIWEEGIIRFYCDGKCYFECDSWYTAASRSNPNAPFDQRFYLILNLAAGGSYDNFNEPDESFTQANMSVDYVRV